MLCEIVNISSIINKLHKILWRKLNFLYFCFHLREYGAFYKLSATRNKVKVACNF